MNTISQKVYISIGTNQGDLTNNIYEALSHIEKIDRITIDATSPIYTTEPQGNTDLQWFQNQVIRLLVKNMTPIQLLDILLDIEQKMGRIRTDIQKKNYEARIIDLDILMFGKECFQNKNLILPHPRMLKRAFVLVPLNDIEPTLNITEELTPHKALERLTYRVVGNFIYQ